MTYQKHSLALQFHHTMILPASVLHASIDLFFLVAHLRHLHIVLLVGTIIGQHPLLSAILNNVSQLSATLRVVRTPRATRLVGFIIAGLDVDLHHESVLVLCQARQVASGCLLLLLVVA